MVVVLIEKYDMTLKRGKTKVLISDCQNHGEPERFLHKLHFVASIKSWCYCDFSRITAHPTIYFKIQCHTAFKDISSR